MRKYKHIEFGEGINCTLAEFKKMNFLFLKVFTDKEIEEAYKVATKGNNIEEAKSNSPNDLDANFTEMKPQKKTVNKNGNIPRTVKKGKKGK